MTDAKEPISLSPQQAHQMLHDDPRAVLVDIRSSMEFLFVGHPSGAVHIAWIDEPDWIVNPHFVTDIRKLLLGGVSCDEGKGCAPVILICRSGKRSLERAASCSRTACRASTTLTRDSKGSSTTTTTAPAWAAGAFTGCRGSSASRRATEGGRGPPC